MSKIFGLALIALGVFLVLSGAVEVKVHAEKIRALPEIVLSGAKDGSRLGTAQRAVLKARRFGENLLIQDKPKRLEVALLNVQADAKRLQQALESKAEASTLLPDAEMLLDSLRQVRTAAQLAPVDAVAARKEDSARAFADARQVLQALREQQQEVASIEEELQRLTASLEEQVGSLSSETASPTPSPSSAPLKF